MSKHAVVAVIAGSTLALCAVTACGEDPGTKGDAATVSAIQAPPPPPPPSASASLPPGAPRPSAPPSAPPAKPKPKKPSNADKKLQSKLDKLVKKNPIKFDDADTLDEKSLQTVSDIARAMQSSTAKLQVVTTADVKSAKAARKRSTARLKAVVDELKADGLDENRIQGDAAGKGKKKSTVEFKVG